jgi:hypothetical protein
LEGMTDAFFGSSTPNGELLMLITRPRNFLDRKPEEYF